MSRTRLIVLLVLSFALSTLLPVFAQESLPLDKTYTSSDGLVSFQYPADWAISSNNDATLILNISVGTSESVLDKDVVSSSSAQFASGEVRVNLIMMKKSDFTSVLKISASASVADVIRAIVKQAASDSVTFGDISKTTVGDRKAARASFSGSQRGEGFVLLADYGGDVIGGAAVFAAADELAQWEPTALDIIASLNYGAGPQPTAQPATEVPVGAALDLTETYTTSNNAASFNYPSGWIVTDNYDPSAFLDVGIANKDSVSNKNLGTAGDVFAPGEVKVQLLVIPQGTFISVDSLDANSTPIDILNALQKQGSIPDGMTMSVVSATSIHDLPGAQFQVTMGATGDGRVVLIRYRPGLLLLLAVFAASGELPKWDATARAMLESVVISADVNAPTPFPTLTPVEIPST